MNSLQKYNNLKHTAKERGYTSAASAEERSKGKDVKINSPNDTPAKPPNDNNSTPAKQPTNSNVSVFNPQTDNTTTGFNINNILNPPAAKNVTGAGFGGNLPDFEEMRIRSKGTYLYAKDQVLPYIKDGIASVKRSYNRGLNWMKGQPGTNVNLSYYENNTKDLGNGNFEVRVPTRIADSGDAMRNEDTANNAYYELLSKERGAKNINVEPDNPMVSANITQGNDNIPYSGGDIPYRKTKIHLSDFVWH